MSKPLMRIPYTGPLPPPLIIPKSATSLHGAAQAIYEFLTSGLQGQNGKTQGKKTVLLTGAGISVASGLADYRGTKGTYTQNKSYRPIYYHEFVSSHEARKRYWARSFLGWNSLHKSAPNPAHHAVGDLGIKHQLFSSVITQNVDSFHPRTHPSLPCIELHGYLRALVCTSCHNLMPRDAFQSRLMSLNPRWADFLTQLIASGALDTENPEERRKKGYRTNPDGDADVPGAPYTTFRYPACPTCLSRAPILKDGSKGTVAVDADGAWDASRSNAGILKPNVIMFGESIPDSVKAAAEKAVDDAARLLVVGSSLATYSAWRLVKKAFDQDMPIGILNLGGVRKEEAFYPDWETKFADGDGTTAVRASFAAEDILPRIVEMLDQK